MAAEAASDEAAPAPRPTFSFLDLPAETQQEIVSHCSQSDLICVALVSKRFHELAAAQLYRSFNILFPDDDDMRFDSPIDGLAGGLDTFTTSEYNYAKHLKELSMDTVSTGIKAEHAYKPYLYSASCGKFLNTLLALTLKNAKSLETFRWNIRVELSRPVYRELHKIPTLSTFHIRMQVGESYYITPPPLPLVLDDIPPQNHWSDIPPPPGFPAPATGSSSLNMPMPKGKGKLGKRSSQSREPPTLSGLKKLKNLSVLDIDSLDVVSELKTCVRNSSSTLRDLQLSLSDSLALQARNTLPGDSDPDDSDVDDEFQGNPTSPGSNFEESGPAKTFRSQEERKLQESVLGRIFDVEPFIVKKSPFQQSPRNTASGNDKNDGAENGDTADPREEFVASIKGVSTKLMSLHNGSRDFSTAQQDILDVIEKAARKYVDSGNLPDKTPGEGSSTDNVSEGKKESEAEQLESKGSSSSTTTVNQSKGKGVEGEISPEDIEIEHPDVADDIEDESDGPAPKDCDEKPPGGSPSTDLSETPVFTSSMANTSGMSRAITNLAAQLNNSEALSTRLVHFQEQANVLGQKIKDMCADGDDADPSRVDEAEMQMKELHQSIVDIQRQIKIAEAEIRDVTKQLPSNQKEAKFEGARRYMDDYLRDTRGIALETLSIHLIPVKPSVLSRAIDLRCLKNLTLLNVGNQAPIWTLLAKENKSRPLALRSIFTDHVSPAFLYCVSLLDEVHELFMLERSSKHRPESFAPKSTVNVDAIRRLVLKKHMPTLKRLMIKDESNGSHWDVNQKAMILICTRGVELEELAVSMNIHAVHAFMQYFAGLVSLKAINILHFRNNDTCIWVMRETLNFIVDNLSHHPELKLEWIAMEDDRLDRVIRPSQTAKSSQESSKRRNKGKGKATASTNHSSDAFPMLSLGSDWGSDSDSDEDEDDAFNNGKRLRLKTVGVLQFYEVWGIKIFEKEIRSGRL